jgi:hypothetical protein
MIVVSALLARLHESASAFRDWLLAEIETDWIRTLEKPSPSGARVKSDLRH